MLHKGLLKTVASTDGIPVTCVERSKQFSKGQAVGLRVCEYVHVCMGLRRALGYWIAYMSLKNGMVSKICYVVGFVQ